MQSRDEAGLSWQLMSRTRIIDEPGMAVLNKLDLRGNRLDDAAKQSLRDAVATREAFELLLEWG